ncbi:MAG TPA: 2-amino-4-hydroxy-6-hydroxymethyldihydropteridine diphosphokinase [Bacilli bacterium]
MTDRHKPNADVCGGERARMDKIAKHIARSNLETYTKTSEADTNPTDSDICNYPRRERTAYISLGSNVGDRAQYLYAALRDLKASPGIRVEICSSVYETEPVGYTEQPDFLNMVAKLATTLAPLSLLDRLQRIESAHGRTRTIRWGPRSLDLDLLCYENERMDSPRLTLPHPRMLERAFVLVPLAEIFKRENSVRLAFVTEALAKLEGKEDVKLWTKAGWQGEFGLTEN